MRILLVDDEEQILKGVSRLIQCEEDAWEVETALSGYKALELLSEEDFDVVVSDMKMPGMDGAELLTRIEELYPSTLRVVLSGQAKREAVLRAIKPMHQYLAKPCDPDKLFEVINRAQIFQETIKSTEVLDAIGQANCLPTFPEIVREINREIEADHGSRKAVADIVAKDPILTAKVLQVANSAIFALRYPISDLERAVSLVGLDMLRSIAFSHAVFPEDEAQQKIKSIRNLTDHCFQVASIGKRLAKHVGLTGDEGNSIFMAGLLHDAGKIILMNAFPEKYSEVLLEAEAGACLQELELANFEATHDGIGGYLFTLWRLPLEVVKAVASHHSFESCSLSESPITRLVFAANWLARRRDTAELGRLADKCGDENAARQFIEQIRSWKKFIDKFEEK